MLIPYSYKKLSLRAKKYLIDKFTSKDKEKLEITYAWKKDKSHI